MQFIVAQQAQFSADIQRIKEVQGQSVTDVQQLREAQQRSQEAQQRLQEAQQQLLEAETTMMRAMTTVVGLHGQMNDRVSRLETAVAEVAERVSAFIAALSDGKGRRGRAR